MHQRVKFHYNRAKRGRVINDYRILRSDFQRDLSSERNGLNCTKLEIYAEEVIK